MRRRTNFFEALMCSNELRPLAKTIYVVAEAMQPKSISELARLVGVDRTAASEACSDLVRLGWMRFEKLGVSQIPVAAVPPDHQQKQVLEFRNALAMAQQKGEFLMKRWLDLLVATDDYVDNARPEFLSNPASGELLEFDRYYLEGVAFEFNGPQHYGPTEAFPDKEKFKETRMRDLIKMGLSREKGIDLVIVTGADLTYEAMLGKIPSRLPLARVCREDPYVKALESASDEYRQVCPGKQGPRDRQGPQGQGSRDAQGGKRVQSPITGQRR